MPPCNFRRDCINTPQDIAGYLSLYRDRGPHKNDGFMEEQQPQRQEQIKCVVRREKITMGVLVDSLGGSVLSTDVVMVAVMIRTLYVYRFRFFV